MFHYLFPPLTIGMGIVLVYLEGMYLRTREPIYETAARFWTTIFAVNFAIGVASGIVMEFQFGTNWAGYSRFVGDVFGSALAAEGIFAFFLESGFLAVLVFGWDKVTARFHFVATVAVAVGSMFSAVWIIVANSWQQTPAGHRIASRVEQGLATTRAETADFWGVVFNPSTIDRLSHTLIGAFVVGAFFIMSISAWYLLKGKHEDFARRSFTGALLLATLSSLGMLVTGHSNAKMVAKHQPAKLAAFEGHFTTGPAALNLFGVPDEASGRVEYGASIPGMLSFLVHEDTSKPVIGLDKIPREYWPPLNISFQSYHVMVALGMLFIALTVFATILRWRGSLFNRRWLLRIFVFAVLGPFAANQLGWVAAEVGRQPWIVVPNVIRDAAGNPALDQNGMLRFNLAEGLLTRDAVSRSISSAQVLGSILMFATIYLLLFAIWLYVLNDKIQKGPKPVLIGDPQRGGWLKATAARALHEDSLSEAKDRPEPEGA
jgi:cytochrome d ubiquinol oxidase subunit I